MSLITIVLTLIVVGVLLYAINAFIPMEGAVKRILNGVVIIVLLVWLLKVFGIWSYLGNVKI